MTGAPVEVRLICRCDFCTGKKRLEEWCARCAEVRLNPPRPEGSMGVCPACGAEIQQEVADDLPVLSWESTGDHRPAR